jgi:hypothetical protein
VSFGRAVRTHILRLIKTQNQALRALTPSQLHCSINP